MNSIETELAVRTVVIDFRGHGKQRVEGGGLEHWWKTNLGLFIEVFSEIIDSVMYKHDLAAYQMELNLLENED